MLKEHVDVGVVRKTEMGHVEVLACLNTWMWAWLERLKWDTWRYLLKEHVGVAGRTEVGHVEVLTCLKSTWMWV